MPTRVVSLTITRALSAAVNLGACHGVRVSAVPELDLARLRKYVEVRNERIPPDARGQITVDMDVAPGSVTILECRPPWRPEYGPEWTRFPIARLRYVKARREWSLYWRDRNLKFHRYDLVDPTPNVQRLLDEIDADPTGIFSG